MKKIGFIFLIVATFTMLQNIKEIKAENQDWVNYSINDTELYNETNTYQCDNIFDYKVSYDMSNFTGQSISTQEPMITVLTPGWSSTAQVWSNHEYEFTYLEDSLITRLSEKTTGSYIYLYKMINENQFNVIALHEQHDNDLSEGYDLNITMNTNQPIITDLSKHIIILFESDNPTCGNDYVYRQLNYVISKAIYDVKYILNGQLPKINLIGHSRGGLTNLQYALEHPYLVDSIFSLGTPYLGSTSASIFTELILPYFPDFIGVSTYSDSYIEEENNSTSPDGGAGLKGEGLSDILDDDVYLDYLGKWNSLYELLYSNINYYSLCGYSDFELIKQIYIEASNDGSINTDELEEFFISIQDILKIIYNNVKDNLSSNIIENCIVLLSNLISQYCDNENAEYIVDLLVNNIDFIDETPYVIFRNDMLVDLNSQKGCKKINGVSYTYKGFTIYEKMFTLDNCDLTKLAQETFPVVHNMETRDEDFISYILNNINMNNEIYLDYETYEINENEIGISKILANVNISELVIPNYIDNKKVVEIGEYAFCNNFNGNNSITTITIPNTIKTIKKGAFSDCNYLQNVIFEENSQLQLVGNKVFYNCYLLQSDVLPLGSYEKGEFIYLNCKLLTQFDYNNFYYNNDVILNCRCEQQNKEMYFYKNYKSYFKIDIECPARYEFTAESDKPVSIALYSPTSDIIFEQTVSIKEGTYEKIVLDLAKGTYYLRVNFDDESHEGNINIKFNHRPTTPETLVVNDEDGTNVLTHLHDAYNEFVFCTSTRGFYNAALHIESNEEITYPSQMLSVCRMVNGELVNINKYNFENIDVDISAQTNINENNIVVYLEEYINYYFIIHCESVTFEKFQITLSNLTEVTLGTNDNYIYQSNVNSGDSMNIIRLDRTGEFSIVGDYNSNETNDSLLFLMLKQNSDNTFTEICCTYVTNLVRFDTDMIFNTGEIIYIGYLTNSNEGEFTLEITRNISNNFTLIVDPNTNVTHGSQVRLMGGECGVPVMTQGFTRICYLGIDAPYVESRTQYNWYSTDTSVAIVSNFGTITATALWTSEELSKKVIIRAVYKNDITVVGEIEITVYKDTNASSTNIIKKYGMDVRQDGTIGTEVSSGKGPTIIINDNPTVTIHKGYTRLVCLGDDSPTNIIQHFNWTTLQDEGDTGYALVSQYGTITGTVEGNVTIKGTYIYNPRYVVYIRITVLPNV